MKSKFNYILSKNIKGIYLHSKANQSIANIFNIKKNYLNYYKFHTLQRMKTMKNFE